MISKNPSAPDIFCLAEYPHLPTSVADQHYFSEVTQKRMPTTQVYDMIWLHGKQEFAASFDAGKVSQDFRRTSLSR